MTPNFNSDWGEPDGDGIRLVEFAGELDLAAADSVRDRLLEAVGGATVILEISDLEFLDSSGLALLIAARQLADAKGHGVALVHASKPGVSKVLELSGVGERMGIHKTVAEARESVSR